MKFAYDDNIADYIITDIMNNTKYEILIENISPNVTKEHLQEIFTFFGVITSIEFKPFSKKHCRLTANITFESYSQAENAKDSMNGGQIDGMILRVSQISHLIKEDIKTKHSHSRSRSRSNSPQYKRRYDKNDNSSSYSSFKSSSHSLKN